MTTITATVVEDSTAQHGVRLVTLELVYPRFVHAELLTHRVLSRNASSSRAIPVRRVLGEVWRNPATPVHWGANRPGMQAREELQGWRQVALRGVWRLGSLQAAALGWLGMQLGGHKQVVNRLLEPYQHMRVIVTATEWANFFELRDHPDAQPEIRELAVRMRSALACSRPVFRKPRPSDARNWHLPYVSLAERHRWRWEPELLAKLATARCARVSYLNHDGTEPQIHKDLALYEQLVGARPLHASPTEHAAHPLAVGDRWVKNFRGWHQYRRDVEQALVQRPSLEHA